MAIEGEYPIPEYLIVTSSMKDDWALILPETLRAPHLHHLVLSGFAFPTESQLPLHILLYIEYSSTDPRPTVLLR